MADKEKVFMLTKPKFSLAPLVLHQAVLLTKISLVVSPTLQGLSKCSLFPQELVSLQLERS